MNQPLPGGVQATREDATASGGAPLLVVDDVIAAIGLTGEVHPDEVLIERIGEGQSNLTYLFACAAGRFVVRRPPPPPYQQSAHDVLREAKVIRALAGTEVRVPDVVAISADPASGPFYVTRFLSGDVITDRTPRRFDDAASREAIGHGMVDALLEVHAVPVQALPIAPPASSDGYVERQLSRYMRSWDAVKVRDIPDLDAVARELVRGQPPRRRDVLVHGDFRLGNLMWSDTPRPQLEAVLDWELASVGDPLADLAYFLTTYPDPADGSDVLLDMAGAVQSGGFPARAALADRYAESAGVDLGRLGWYEAFVRWRAAIGLESIYQRARRGSSEPGPWTASLRDGVPLLASKARASLAEVGR